MENLSSEPADLEHLGLAVEQCFVDSWSLNRGSSFLLAPSTLKVYVTAIAAFHTLEGGVSLGKNKLVSHFLHEAR